MLFLLSFSLSFSFSFSFALFLFPNKKSATLCISLIWRRFLKVILISSRVYFPWSCKDFKLFSKWWITEVAFTMSCLSFGGCCGGCCGCGWQSWVRAALYRFILVVLSLQILIFNFWCFLSSSNWINFWTACRYCNTHGS